MRILLIGATGTIGSEVARALSSGHEIVSVSRGHTAITVDIADPQSIRAMYQAAGKVDAVICAAGGARRKPLAELSDDDFDYSIRNKLMGQVNVIRYGFDHVSDNGCFIVTSGILGREPIAGSQAISLVNLGLEGFVAAAALEAPRGIRVNAVSPPWATETLQEYGMKGMNGLPAARIATAYGEALQSSETGRVFEPK